MPKQIKIVVSDSVSGKSQLKITHQSTLKYLIVRMYIIKHFLLSKNTKDVLILQIIGRWVLNSAAGCKWYGDDFDSFLKVILKKCCNEEWMLSTDVKALVNF